MFVVYSGILQKLSFTINKQLKLTIQGSTSVLQNNAIADKYLICYFVGGNKNLEHGKSLLQVIPVTESQQGAAP